MSRTPAVPTDALLDAIGRDYALGEGWACVPVRRGFNDHYAIERGDERWIVRVYVNGKYYVRDDGDFRFELDLLAHLDGDGVPVAAPLPRHDGELMGAIDPPDGERRWYALFRNAPGAPAADGLTPEQAEELGAAAGRLHVSADRFSSPHHRYHFDLRYLVHEPVRLIDDLLARHGKGSLDRYRHLIDALIEPVEAIPREGGGYGYIHGDLHTGNIHVDGTDVTLFDFDHSGYGWRAFDLATFAMCVSPELNEAFLRGYRRHREPMAEELAAQESFRYLRFLWDIGDVLAMREAWGDDPRGGDADERRERDAAWCDRILATIDEVATAPT